jgi:hypothetical protein
LRLVLLSPENARVLGYQVAHLESEQAKQFVAGLLKRLGKAPPMEHREDDVPMERPQPTIPRGAAPAQTLGARRRLTQIPRQLPAPPSIQAPPVEVSPPPIIRLTPRLIPKAESSRIAGRKPASPESLTLSQTRPARAARNQASFRLDALYQQPFPLHDDDDDKAFANPRQQHQNHDTNRGRTATTAQYHSSEPDYDFDVDDSVIRQVDEVEQRASGQRAAYEIDEEDDEFDVDDSFMRHVEDIEARAGKRPRVMAEDRAEVIEISD